MTSIATTSTIRRLELADASCRGRYTSETHCHSRVRGRRDHTTLVSAAIYSPWRVDREFQSVFEIIKDSTLLDEMRLYELWRLAGQVGHIEGDAIEVGSWRGGAGGLIARRIADRLSSAHTYLCDTFTGVVKAGANDPTYRGGEHADSSPDMVRSLADQLKLRTVEVLAGIFPDDTGDQVQERRFKFVHMDLDVYQGSRDAFEWLLHDWLSVPSRFSTITASLLQAVQGNLSMNWRVIQTS